MDSWAGDVVRILEADGPPEVFWLIYQFRGPPVPLEVTQPLIILVLGSARTQESARARRWLW